MNFQEAVQFCETNKDKIVNISRNWNNSMYIYSDYITLWENGRTREVYVGTDFFDGHKLTINIESDAYKEYEAEGKKNIVQYRKALIKQNAELFFHHGKLTAYKLALWMRGMNGRETLINLLKTKTFRSSFRQSLCNQILAWIRTPAKQRKYDFPLSPKQRASLFSNCSRYGYRKVFI